VFAHVCNVDDDDDDKGLGPQGALARLEHGLLGGEVSALSPCERLIGPMATS